MQDYYNYNKDKWPTPEEMINGLSIATTYDLKKEYETYYMLWNNGTIGLGIEDTKEILEDLDDSFMYSFIYQQVDYTYIEKLENNIWTSYVKINLFKHLGYKSVSIDKSTGKKQIEAIVEYQGNKYQLQIDSTKNDQDLISNLTLTNETVKEEYKVLKEISSKQQLYQTYIQNADRVDTNGDTKTSYFYHNFVEYKYIEQTTGNTVISRIETTGIEVRIAKISTGYGGNAVAIDENGKVWTWGSNYAGELGNGTNEDSSAPICISNNGPLQDVVVKDIALCHEIVMVIDSNGKVWAWGRNTDGQLGNGTNDNSNIPICVNNYGSLQGSYIKSIYEVDYDYIIALDANGKIHSWGANSEGQLGNGTNENSNIPICISNSGPLQGVVIKEVQSYDRSTVAIDSNGKIWTWGYNYSGQLGNGTNVSSNIPICISNSGPLQGVVIKEVQSSGNSIAE
jgi:hypothetical protein